MTGIEPYSHLTDPLRNRRVTASSVSAILGNSPWQTADDVMRRMVRDALDAPSEWDGNVATAWGQANEAGAILEFEMETGLSTEKAKFVTRDDWAGATVDAWVSDGGILETKCPYGLRKAVKPAPFKTLVDQPGYADQVQFQLWVTDRPHAWFWQWCPADTDLTPKVLPDQEWRDRNLPVLRQFYARFLSELETPDDHLAPLRVVIDTPEAARMLREYMENKERAELLAERQKELLADIVEKCGGKNALFAGAKVTQTNRKGSISYSKAIKALKIEADFEPFRGKGSSFWGITE